MPEELLRDAGRTGGVAGRSPRRWSLIPFSIALHVVAAVAVVIVPLLAAVSPPDPAPLHRARPWVVTMARDVDVPRATLPRAVAAPAAPTSAPSSIAAEPPSAPASAGIPSPVAVSEGIVGSVPGTVDAAATPVVVPPPPPPARPQRPEPVRISGAIRAPRKISGTAPVYPEIAVRARVEGVVILEALIDERGRVDRVRVLRSQPLLDAAAIEAVGGWRYTPTLLNGVPVPVLMTVTVNFNLQR